MSRHPLWVALFAASGLSEACSLHVKPDDGDTPGGKDEPGCVSPEPILDAGGAPTGFVRCEDGSIDRVAALPTDPTVPGPACTGAEQDQSCAPSCGGDGKSRCVHVEYPPDTFWGGDTDGVSTEPTTACLCVTSCATDADCGAGRACAPKALVGELALGVVWNEPVGMAACIPAGCTTNADCDSHECGFAGGFDGCEPFAGLSCRTAASTCRSDADCVDGDWGVGACTYDTGWGPAFTCLDCTVGRPILVDGQVRVAPVVRATGWGAGTGALPHAPASSARWARVAALEHASVAAFARFTLQLQALGAPAALVGDTIRAMADEVRHAEGAFGVASGFGRDALGPGPLDLHGLAISVAPAQVLRELIDEGCLGETLSAADAQLGAQLTTCDAVRDLCAQVAADETRHAALAWRTVRWLLAADPTLLPVARACFDDAMRAAVASPCVEADLPDHGLIGGARRERLVAEVVEAVVRPLADAVLEEARRAEERCGAAA